MNGYLLEFAGSFILSNTVGCCICSSDIIQFFFPRVSTKLTSDKWKISIEDFRQYNYVQLFGWKKDPVIFEGGKETNAPDFEAREYSITVLKFSRLNSFTSKILQWSKKDNSQMVHDQESKEDEENLPYFLIGTGNMGVCISCKSPTINTPFRLTNASLFLL